MPFIPNELDAFSPTQSAPDSGDFEVLRAGSDATGVVVGAAVTAQGSPDMTVAVASGVVAVAGSKVNVVAGNVTITAAHATLFRHDLIVVSSAGAKSAVAGTPAAEMGPGQIGPVFPAIPASSVVLAAVYVPAADTDIDANQITDKRVFVIPPAPTTNYDLAKARDIPLVKERSQTVTLDSGQDLIHGSALVGDRLFCTTRTAPIHMIRFNNLNDLTDRTVSTSPTGSNYSNGEALIYVAEKNRLYVGVNRSSRVVIHELDPDTLVWTTPIDEAITFGQGLSPALASDGTHIYILTYNTTSKIYKYRLSDYVQVASVSLTGRGEGHAMIYDGEYLYAGGDQWVAKVNPADLTYVDAALPQTGQVTDDGICSAGDYIFVGQEAGTGEQVHRIEKDSLSTAVASGIGDVDTYALHFDGSDVWHVGPGTPGTVRRIDPKTLAVQSYTMASGENDPGEIVSDSAGRLFVAFFLSPAKVKRFFPLPTDGSHAQVHDIDGANHDGYPGGTTNFLRADGSFAAPPSHVEDHDHDGTPTQKLLAANAHESPSADTHHAQNHGASAHTDPETGFYRFKTGFYYPIGAHGANSTPTLDELRLTWFPVSKTVTMDRIGLWVNAGVALSVIRLGIYRDNGTGYPGTLVLDAGTIDASSSGFKEITISQQLTPDWYWVGGVGQTLVAAMTCSCLGSTPALALMPRTAAPGAATDTGLAGFSQASVSGALPGTFTSTATNASIIPRVFLRAA